MCSPSIAECSHLILPATLKFSRFLVGSPLSPLNSLCACLSPFHTRVSVHVFVCVCVCARVGLLWLRASNRTRTCARVRVCCPVPPSNLHTPCACCSAWIGNAGSCCLYAIVHICSTDVCVCAYVHCMVGEIVCLSGAHCHRARSHSFWTYDD